MKESSLWKWMDRWRPGDRLHLTRVEDVAGVGRPDVEGCLDGDCFVIELKVADRPRRPTTPIRTQCPITIEQQEWLKARRSAGGNAFLLIQVGDHADARRYLLDGRQAASAASGLTEEELVLLCVVDPLCTAEQLLLSAARR